MSGLRFQTPLTLAVGVTGHRTLANPDAVRRQLDAVFAAIAAATEALNAGNQISLRLISPLAEGADRLFAQAGLASRGTLHVPLPFSRDEYLKDFTQASSCEDFAGLLARAERVLELDGDPRGRESAYLEVGHLVVAYSDVLVAVWDAQPAHGRGGTAEIVAGAIRDGLIVVGVDPAGLRPPGMLHGPGPQPHWGDLDQLTERIGALLTLPPGSKSRAASKEFSRTASELFAESQRRWASLFPQASNLATVCAPCVAGLPIEAFARADSLATRYARLYRRAFLANFLLSAFAVTMALLGEQHREVINRLLELLSIVVIVVLTAIANRRNWHERWIEYRHLAEQLRPLRFLFPLGLSLPKSHSGRPLQADERLTGWADWLVRRVEIGLGFPSAKLTPDYLGAVRDFVMRDILEEQISYHRRKAERMHRLDHLFHQVGIALFILTGVACLCDIFDLTAPSFLAGGIVLTTAREIQPILIFTSGVAPAFGAALLGIRNVGEYDRLERRSSAMAAALEQTRATLAHQQGGRLRRDHLAPHLDTIAAQMISETADWRTLVITRRIEWPG